MDAVLQPIASTLDHLRGVILRTTLESGFLRGIFRVRARRLTALFLFVAAFDLMAAVLFPLWVLILGPILFGVPHLFASLRYVQASVSGPQLLDDPALRARSLRFLGGIFAGVAVFRILTDLGIVTWAPSVPLLPEIFSTAISFGGLAWIFRKAPRRITLGLFWVVPVLTAAWLMPRWTTGALLLLHNFVGFAYWLRATRTPAERRAAWLATAIFASVHVLIFLGVFDLAYRLYTPAAAVQAADLDYSDLGRMIAPFSSSYVVWFHCVVAYAFGQSMHYFVWMKAIPDQNHRNEVPTSFRQSLALLTEDFGRAYAYGILAIALASLAAWCLMSLPQARIAYFAVAAFHGYLEIAGIGLSRDQSA